MYCGDETGSFIGDIQYDTSQFGYGGNNVPSYIVPSIVGIKENTGSRNDDTIMNEGSAKATRTTILPTSCYNYKSNYDYRVPMRRALLSPSSVSSAPRSTSSNISSGDDYRYEQPITDPIAYLQQGDSITDWDAYESIWQNAIDTLRVNDLYKHSSSSTSKQASSRSLSTTTTAAGDHNCTHPFLVVSPGITHSMIMDDKNDSSSEMSRKKSQKEMIQITELMMETFNVPACFIAPSPMLIAFAHGRQNALIVNITASGTCVTPVMDGLLLRQSQRRSGRGTDWIQNCIWQALLNQQEQRSTSSPTKKKKYNLTPRYQLKSTYKSCNTRSDSIRNSCSGGIFHRWAMNDLMYEIRSSEHVSLPHWWYDPTVPFLYDEDDDEIEDTDQDVNMIDDDNNIDNSGNSSTSDQCYELPDGTKIDLTTRVGKDICRVPELLFTEQCPFSNNQDSKLNILLNQHSTLSNAPLHQLIHQSLGAIPDVDVRRELTSSIILSGSGSASIHNLASRLSLELSRITSSAYKPKVLATGYGTTINANTASGGVGASTTKSYPPTSVERQCSAWIGGSILTSLGSFQQLWLSKAEYDEYGGTLAIQRFP